jgi:hypothetical protein
VPEADERALARRILLHQPSKGGRLETYESEPEERDIKEGKDHERVSAIN